MYCRKCGKFIDYDAEYCIECRQVEEQARQANVVPPVQPTYPIDNGSVTTGLGKAIASATLSFFGYVFSLLAFIFCIAYVSGGLSVGGATVFLTIALGFSITALIFGIQSVKVFVNEKNAGRKKPIPALVLGIFGISFSGLALFFCFLAFIILIAGISVY